MFKDISIDNYKTISSFLNFEFNKDYIESELQFQNIFAWKETDNLKLYINHNYAVLKGKIFCDFFFPPIAKDEKSFSEALSFIENYCYEKSIPILFYAIPEKFKNYFQNYKLFSQRNYFEYIHLSKDLIELKGKKYHSKRNHISQFLKTHSYEFLSYEKKFREDVEKLIDFWNSKNEKTNEKQAIFNILDNLFFLDCFCDCIFVDNYLCGFAIGFISNNTGIILFEKANIECTGIYTMLENLFIKKHFSEVLYVNRQEDMGKETLRKSKLSYNPEFLAKKYLAVKPLNQQLYNLYSLGFPTDSTNYKEFFFTEKIKHLKYKLLRKHNLVLSMFFYKEQILNILNVEFKAKFILALTSHINYRKLHLATKLLCSGLNSFSRNTDFVVLNPTSESFYKKFGFITYTTQTNVDFNLFEMNETVDLKEIKEIYDSVVSTFDVYTQRTNNEFNLWNLEILSDQGKIYLLKSNNKIAGYAVSFNNIVEEFCLTNQKTSPYANMIRICNVVSVLKQFPYKENFEFSLKINDPIIKKNNITLKVSHTNGLTLISETIIFDFEISIEELTELLVLGKTIKEYSISKYFSINTTISLDKY